VELSTTLYIGDVAVVIRDGKTRRTLQDKVLRALVNLHSESTGWCKNWASGTVSQKLAKYLQDSVPTWL